MFISKLAKYVFNKHTSEKGLIVHGEKED